MAAQVRPRRRRRSSHEIHSPRGALFQRVKDVGPEHFGVLAVDCAKARSKWMLADYYGKVLIPPSVVQHNATDFDAAIKVVQQVRLEHQILDLVVVVERTGRYHHPPKKAFTKAGFEVRTIHPRTTKHFRQPADPGDKTDDTDLSAIHRGATTGFGLLEPIPEPLYSQLQLLARHRRDLVEKSSALRCQIQEHLHAILPGYAKCYSDLFECRYALGIATAFPSAAAILRAGVMGLQQWLRAQKLTAHRRILENVLVWARNAAESDSQAELQGRILAELEADRRAKEQAITTIEGDLASLLVQTPYVLLLGCPGINVVSAAELAGEMGPIRYYPNSRAITGRAGLYPSRHQSDQVDRPNGPLIRCANRTLRSVILLIAGNLVVCNDHFVQFAERWRKRGKDPREIYVKVACRFCRIAYHMVAGEHAYEHPCSQQRHYVLGKLMQFHMEHEVTIQQTIANMETAVSQISSSERAREAAPLATELAEAAGRRGAEPLRLGMILPAVIARLGVHDVESRPSGETDLA